MIHILDRLTAILQALEGDLHPRFWSDLHTSYYTRCPFTGKTMRIPYMDANGISYERDLIHEWLRDPSNKISPVSGKSLTAANLIENRSIGDIIELIPPEERVVEDKPNFELIDFRYQYVLYWYCKLKSPIDQAALNEIHRRINLIQIKDNKWWPVVNDKDFVCGLTWTAFPRLRQMVYGEFAQIENLSVAYDRLPEITDNNLKIRAKQCMVDAMINNFNESKARQIDIAVNTFRSSNGYIPHRRIDAERKERWCQEFDIRSRSMETQVIPAFPPVHQNSPWQIEQPYIDMATPQIAHPQHDTTWPSNWR